MEAKDKGSFDKTIRDLLILTGKLFKPTPSIVKTYWLAAERFPLDTVLAAMSEMSRTLSGHFTPGDLARACLEEQNARRRRQEFATGPAAETVYTEEDDAAHAASMAECRRMLASKLPASEAL